MISKKRRKGEQNGTPVSVITNPEENPVQNSNLPQLLSRDQSECSLARSSQGPLLATHSGTPPPGSLFPSAHRTHGPVPHTQCHGPCEMPGTLLRCSIDQWSDRTPLHRHPSTAPCRGIPVTSETAE